MNDRSHVTLTCALMTCLALVACDFESGTTTNAAHRDAPLERSPSSFYKPGMGDLMSALQLRHAKLWYAGEAENWELAAFELHEIEETFERVERWHPEEGGLPVGLSIQSHMHSAIEALERGVAQRDSAAFGSAFDRFTQGCNGCHQAMKHGFIIIRRPAAEPVRGRPPQVLMASAVRKLSEYSIWGFAFGYFASYVPYSALTKAVSSGHVGGQAVPGVELLPISAAASLVGMFAFITLMGWWKHASRTTILGKRVPFPTRWTFLSGLCTSAIIATTTLAYTFEGISIVFMMLLLRGGVLILAPIIDLLSGRRVRWFSGIGLLLSLAALLVAFLEDKDKGFGLTELALIDVGVYLLAYFIRLQFMSRLAKSDDADQRTRYFVEEQMVGTPMLMLFLAACALIDQGDFMHLVRAGFTDFFDRPASIVATGIVIGICSQGTGIFGGLILLDKRENTYCVPVNRCSSILAGVAASYVGMATFGGRAPSSYELAGAGLIVAAILVLTLPLLRKKRALA